MAYAKQTWRDGPSGATPITAARLDKIENGIASAQSTADSALATATTGAVAPDLVAELFATSPFYIAHRGSGDDFPEHTMTAYEGAVNAGAKAIEVSVVLSADGVLMCGHDTTVDRVTAGTGNYSAFHQTGLRTIPVDMSEWLGSGWGTVPHTPLREVLDRFLGKVVIFLEPKVSGVITPMLDLLDTYSTDPTLSVVGKGYKAGPDAPNWKSRGYRLWAYVDFDTPLAECSTILQTADYLGIPHGDEIGPFQTFHDIPGAVALGSPVIAWEVHRRWAREYLTSLGVQGMMSAGWKHVTRSTPAYASDSFAQKTRPPGDLPRTHSPDWQPSWAGTNELVLDTSFGETYMLGSMGPITASTYTVTFDIAFDTVPATTTKHSGPAFGKPDDSAYRFGTTDNRSGGYHIVLRAGGDLQLYRHDPGSATGVQLATAVDTAPVNGGWRTYQLVVSPTQITLQRTNGTPSTLISTLDTTYRGGYLHLARNWDSADGAVRYRNVVVS